MLCLTRRNGESIKIGKDIDITFQFLSPYVVKVGIEAPKEVIIMRTEVLEREKLNKKGVNDE